MDQRSHGRATAEVLFVLYLLKSGRTKRFINVTKKERSVMNDYPETVRIIAEALGVRKAPVGVTYTDEPPAVEPEPGSYPVCGAILRAANGAVIMLTEDRCACPGGRRHIGLTQRSTIPWQLLVEGEKLWYDVKTAVRSSMETEKFARPPVGLAAHVYFYPVSKRVFRPDLVLLLVDAEQAARLITLNQFWDGKTPSLEMRGSLCWSMVTYPLISGNFNLSVGDISARRMERWDSDLMVASIPVEKLRGIAEAVPLSTAGTAEPSEQFHQMTEEMRAKSGRSGK
jgi:uncharacterized protein (DUF169 family)